MNKMIPYLRRFIQAGLAICFYLLLSLNQGCGNKKIISQELENAKLNFDNNNFKEARESLAELAKKGNLEAQYMLGYMQFYGQGGVCDRNEAKKYFKVSAKQNHPLAKKALAMLEDYDNNQKLLSLKDKYSTTPMHVTLANEVEDTPQGSTSSDRASHELIANENKQRFHKQNESDFYTIQIIGLSDLNRMKSFIQSIKIKELLSFHQTERNGKSWYILTVGRYSSSQAAQKAISTLPQEVRKWAPFVRKYPKSADRV